MLHTDEIPQIFESDTIKNCQLVYIIKKTSDELTLRVPANKFPQDQKVPTRELTTYWGKHMLLVAVWVTEALPNQNDGLKQCHREQGEYDALTAVVRVIESQ